MDDHGSDALEGPVSKWHVLNNTLTAMQTAVAVVGERQKVAADTFERVERSMTAMHGRFDHLTTKIAQLELDTNVRMGKLGDEIKRLEERFAPAKNLTYGFVVLILTAVIGAMVALVMRRG